MVDELGVWMLCHSNGGMKSCITPFTSIHNQNN